MTKALKFVSHLVEGRPALIKAKFRIPMHLGLAARVSALDDGIPDRSGGQKADLFSVVGREPDWEAQSWTYRVTSHLPIQDLARELNRQTYYARKSAGVVGIAVQAEGLVDILA